MSAIHSDETYIDTDPFQDDTAIQCRTVSIKTARKEHQCYGLGDCCVGHHIKPGDRYRHEKALCEGSWGEWRMCFACLDEWLSW